MGLWVVAHIKAKPGKEKECRDSFLPLVAPSREEESCILYDMFEVKGDPGHLVLVEKWTSEEGYEAHINSEKNKKWGHTGMKEFVDSLEVLRCLPIDVQKCTHNK